MKKFKIYISRLVEEVAEVEIEAKDRGEAQELSNQLDWENVAKEQNAEWVNHGVHEGAIVTDITPL